jgi:hydrogenase maturation protease
MVTRNCVVVGIGNPLRGDDGIGVHAVKYLKGRLPHDVTLVEGEVYSLDLLPYLEGRDQAIFIDGLDAKDDPGAVFRFNPRDVAQSLPAPSMSMHDFGLYDLITAAELLDQCPSRVTIIAVQVKSMEWGTELSSELLHSLPQVHRLVVEEIDG